MCDVARRSAHWCRPVLRRASPAPAPIPVYAHARAALSCAHAVDAGCAACASARLYCRLIAEPPLG
jgi:hypothetical protein